MSRNKKKPNPYIMAVIPVGDPERWAVFFADLFLAVSADGRVLNGGSAHHPTSAELAAICGSLPIAIQKVEDYLSELKAAQRVFSNESN